MVHSKGCGRLGQATPDTILEHPDHLFYLPVGLTVSNGDVVMDDAQPFLQDHAKLSANLAPLLVWM